MSLTGLQLPGACSEYRCFLLSCVGSWKIRATNQIIIIGNKIYRDLCALHQQALSYEHNSHVAPVARVRPVPPARTSRLVSPAARAVLGHRSLPAAGLGFADDPPSFCVCLRPPGRPRHHIRGSHGAWRSAPVCYSLAREPLLPKIKAAWPGARSPLWQTCLRQLRGRGAAAFCRACDPAGPSTAAVPRAQPRCRRRPGCREVPPQPL